MDDPLNWLVVACVGFLLFAIGATIVRDKEHDDFLKAHGCQLLTQAPTGRYHRVGTIREMENVYVYECADGTKTEVH